MALDPRAHLTQRFWRIQFSIFLADLVHKFAEPKAQFEITNNIWYFDGRYLGKQTSRILSEAECSVRLPFIPNIQTLNVRER